MYKITKKSELSPGVKALVIIAPLIAYKCLPGQFVILRIDEEGERIPLTIADFDRTAGTISLIFQELGRTTRQLGTLNEGEAILDVAGPLGNATPVKKIGTVVCIGGGIGIAPVYPIARAYQQAGNKVISIIGARNAELLILEKDMAAVSDTLTITTDDGSKGRQGLVVNPLEDLIASGEKIALVLAIGPVVMMRGVAEVTRPHQIHTVVSLNPIMVDGTGMCGGCRVSVANKNKFACVDGPEFNAHEVDFKELMIRQRMYHNQETIEQHKGACSCHH